MEVRRAAMRRPVTSLGRNPPAGLRPGLPAIGRCQLGLPVSADGPPVAAIELDPVVGGRVGLVGGANGVVALPVEMRRAVPVKGGHLDTGNPLPRADYLKDGNREIFGYGRCEPIWVLITIGYAWPVHRT